MTINVLSGTALPVGTPLWSFDPLPGNGAPLLVKTNPLNPGDPDIYATEAPNTLRGFTADGRQLWAIQVNLPLPASQSNTAPPIAAAQNASPAGKPVSPALAKIIAAHKQLLRDHQVPDPLDFMAQRFHLSFNTAAPRAAAARNCAALHFCFPKEQASSRRLPIMECWQPS